jgi:hypothetical protein
VVNGVQLLLTKSDSKHRISWPPSNLGRHGTTRLVPSLRGVTIKISGAPYGADQCIAQSLINAAIQSSTLTCEQ